MGGVIQGGMLSQWEDDHGLITINRGWAVNIQNVFQKLQSYSLAMNVIYFSIHW